MWQLFKNYWINLLKKLFPTQIIHFSIVLINLSNYIYIPINKLQNKILNHLLVPVASRLIHAAIPNWRTPLSTHLLTINLYLGSYTNNGHATHGNAVVQTKTAICSLPRRPSPWTSSSRWLAALEAYSTGATVFKALSMKSVTVFWLLAKYWKKNDISLSRAEASSSFSRGSLLLPRIRDIFTISCKILLSSIEAFRNYLFWESSLVM